MLEEYLMEIFYLGAQKGSTVKLHMSRTGAELLNKVMQQEVEKRMKSSFARVMYGTSDVANGRSIQHMLIPE